MGHNMILRQHVKFLGLQTRIQQLTKTGMAGTLEQDERESESKDTESTEKK